MKPYFSFIVMEKTQFQLKYLLYKSFLTVLTRFKLVLKDGDDVIKETGVLLSNDAFTWDWNLIKILLKVNPATTFLQQSK